MEGAKTSVVPSSGVDLFDGNGVEIRFVEFCKSGLSLDQETCNEALELLKQTKHLLVSNVSAIGSGTPEEAERFWFAFVLYSVKRLNERNEGESSQGMGESDFNLCQIMREAKLNIAEFFKELQQFVITVGPTLLKLYGSNWERRLEVKELQASFVHLSLLSKYYKRAYREFFLPMDEKVTNNSESSTSSGYTSDYHRFGWLLFLALRVHAFSRFKDLVTCTNGLVSILAILIIHVPVRFRNFSSIDPSRFVKKETKGVDLIASLCNMYNTSEDELRKTLEQTNKIIADILKQKPCPASDCKSETLTTFDTDGLIYFEGLMEEPLFSSSMNILEKDYNDSIRSKSELDERVFINEEDSLLGSASSSGGSMTLNGVKRKIDNVSSPSKTITSPSPPSPHRSDASKSNGNNNTGCAIPKVAATPVSTAMTTAKWLRTVISPLSSKPSPKLELFFRSCDKDVTVDVIRRARIILEAIFPSSNTAERSINGNLQTTNLMDNIWAEQRRLESVKLYYRVLEAMCIAESQVINGSNLTSLLSNERFHRCMLACSAELVLATHKTVTMLFPAVLERTGITPFDLSKVIESFIRHEESLPRELRRHLNSLEERLLESMVWEKGSSLYNSLIVARPSLLQEANSLGLLAEPMPSLDAIALHNSASHGGLTLFPPVLKQETASGQNGDMRSPKRVCTEYKSVLVERNSFTSPTKDRLLTMNNRSKLPPPLQSAFATPTRPLPGGGGETCAETGINVCFNKIIKLAAVRINSMVERLGLSQLIRENVYCLFQKILNQRTSLFFNRHIDQIILCCFYGVAKISQLKLTFRELIYFYRKQPQCKPQVFRSIYVDWSAGRHIGKSGQDHVDVITFYNEVFILSVKPLLLELVPSGTAQNGNQASEANNGQCSGTLKTSTFPSLPDMSPKKVSTSHNVYVSPLRLSKMDALISHSSKSYYACVGESTHAFQSPSKDLSAINNRLNGSLKRRGTLNFDEVEGAMVSDAFIANNLYTIPTSPSQKPEKERVSSMSGVLL